MAPARTTDRANELATTPAASRIPWPAVAVVLAGLFMAILDSYIVIVAGPAMQRDLHASAGELQWVLAGYQLSYAVAMITAGRIADLVGRRRVFLVGTVVFVATSVLCALSPSPLVLVVARLVQGIGAAMIVPQVFTVISLVVPAPARSRAFGVVGVVLGLATAGGQLIGGVLVGGDLWGSGWRAIFLVNVPVGIAVIVLALRYVPESRSTDTRHLDLRGVAVLGLALFLLTYPLIQGRDSDWPWWMFVLLAASVPALALFVRVEAAVERAGGSPLLRLHLFAQRSFSLGLLLVITSYALITSYYLALSVSMQDGLGLSALESGLVYAPAAAMFFVFSLVAGRLVPRYGRRVLVAGGVTLTLGYLATALVLLTARDITPALVVPTLMVQSVGGGLLLTPSLNVVLAGVRADDTGMASGALSTAQQVGAALGIAVVGGLFFHAFRPELDGPREAARVGFTTASFVVCAIAAVATLLVRLLPTMSPTNGADQ